MWSGEWSIHELVGYADRIGEVPDAGAPEWGLIPRSRTAKRGRVFVSASWNIWILAWAVGDLDPRDGRFGSVVRELRSRISAV
jgi:hypothetical protein